MNPSLLATRSLLDSTALIRKQVEKLNRMTGAQYNIFELLRLSTHENSHSLIIADLLDPKGSHGQGEVFLEAFKDELSNIQQTEGGAKLGEHFLNLTKESVRVLTELHLGNKTETDGGRIDIALLSSQETIYIENKIYAGLQDRQLDRYLSNGKPVIFLTLTEDDFEQGELPKKPNLFLITYETHISRWLDRCIEIAATKPPVRESISQYLKIIQKLTGQGGSDLMKEQLREIITRDQESLEAFFELQQCEADIMKTVGERLREIGKVVATETSLRLHDYPFDYSKPNQGLMFGCDTWDAEKLQAGIQFHRHYRALAFGVAHTEKQEDHQDHTLANVINKNFKAALGDTSEPSSWWPARQPFDEKWKDWKAEQFWEILACNPAEGDLGAFGNLILNKVKTMKEEVVDKALKNQ